MFSQSSSGHDNPYDFAGILLEAVPDGAAVLGEDREVMAVNDALVAMSGWKRTDLVGPVLESPFWRTGLTCGLAGLLDEIESGSCGELEIVFHRGEGTRLTALLSTGNLKCDPSGPPRNLVIVKDITSRKLYETELEEARKTFQLVMDTIPQRVFWKDREFNYIGCNRVFAEDAGLKSPDEIIGRNDFELSWKETAPLYRTDDREVMEKDLSKINYEEPQAREDGSRLWLRTTKVPIKNAEGEIIGVFGSYEDISDIKLAEERQLTLEAQLRRAQKMEALGTLAGGIAHDFNNILSAIMGYADLVRNDLPDGDERREDLENLLAAAERGRQLVQRILTYSRVDQQELTFVSLESALDEALRLLRATLPSTIELRPEIIRSHGVVRGTISDIHQIVVNLATNAAHAMGESGGTLTIQLRVEQLNEPMIHHQGYLEPGRYFRLSFVDTGRGIAPEHMDRIFDPFFTTKEVGKGTGLGLSVVFGLLRNLGGAINVESALGEGTRFDLFFPFLDEPETLEDPDSHDEIVRGTEHVLLVDDEQTLVELGARMLMGLGYRVAAFNDPNRALTAFLATPGEFDVVITDQTMPGRTGIELAAEIKAVRQDIPIILVTGFSEGVTAESVLGKGIQALVTKPFRGEILSRNIRRVLSGAPTKQS